MSRLIKAAPTSLGKRTASQSQSEKKVISIKLFEPFNQAEESVQEQEPVDVGKEVQAILNDAKLQATSIIEQAKIEADQMKQQLEEEKKAFDLEKVTIAEQSRQIGLSQGIEEGHQRGFADYAETIQFAKNVIDSAKTDYRKHVESSEKDILEIGLKVAGRILGKIIDDNDEEFIAIVKRAIKEARDNKEVQLHVHPTQYDLLLSYKEELIMLFPKEVDLFIYPNEELSESSCWIESENGRIDASVDSQLEVVKQKLIEMLEGE